MDAVNSIGAVTKQQTGADKPSVAKQVNPFTQKIKDQQAADAKKANAEGAKKFASTIGKAFVPGPIKGLVSSVGNLTGNLKNYYEKKNAPIKESKEVAGLRKQSDAWKKDQEKQAVAQQKAELASQKLAQKEADKKAKIAQKEEATRKKADDNAMRLAYDRVMATRKRKGPMSKATAMKIRKEADRILKEKEDKLAQKKKLQESRDKELAEASRLLGVKL